MGGLECKLQIKVQTFPLHVHLLEQIPPDWLDGLQTQSLDVRGSIISTQRCQVDKSDGLQQPSSLQERRQGIIRVWSCPCISTRAAECSSFFSSSLSSLTVIPLIYIMFYAFLTETFCLLKDVSTCQRPFGIFRAWMC